MNKVIIIDGKEWLINFSSATNVKFCTMMRMSFADFGEAFSINPIGFMFCALDRACSKEKKVNPFENWEELSDHFDEHEQEMIDAMKVVTDHFMKQLEEVDEKK